MKDSKDLQQEIADCSVMKQIKNTNLTCSGTGEDKCVECSKSEPALADMHKKAIVEGFNENELSEENKTALQSETWEAVREGMQVPESQPETEDSAGSKVADFQNRAKAKLEAELQKAKDKSFAEPVIGHLLKRCEEDCGLSEDVCQEHKTWDKCFSYIYEEARKLAKGNRHCAVRDDVVYEWAEDYFHKDDKAEEEKKARGNAQLIKAKERAEKSKKKDDGKSTGSKSFEDSATREHKHKVQKAREEKNAVPEQTTVEKPKKSGKDMDGQLDLFSMMGLKE